MKGHFNKLFRNIASKKGKTEFGKVILVLKHAFDLYLFRIVLIYFILETNQSNLWT